jgi:hypothetical protein
LNQKHLFNFRQLIYKDPKKPKVKYNKDICSKNKNQVLIINTILIFRN